MIIDIFKGWISSMLCVGIFVTFIQLIMPKSNLKKYIYSLIGVVTVLTVVSPVINMLKDQSVQTSVEQVLNNISGTDTDIDQSEAKKIGQDNVKKEFVESVKKDIKEKLSQKEVIVNNINIILNEETYDIELIEVNVEKIDTSVSNLDSINKVVNYLNDEYDIDYSKITVIEEGN